MQLLLHARFGRADIFAITEDPIAGDAAPRGVRSEREREMGGVVDCGELVLLRLSTTMTELLK